MKISTLRLDKEFYLKTWWRRVLPWDWIQNSSTLRLQEEFYPETRRRVLSWDWIEKSSTIHETGRRVLPLDWNKSSILRLEKEFYPKTGKRVLPWDWIEKSSILRLEKEFYLETGRRVLPWDWIKKRMYFCQVENKIVELKKHKIWVWFSRFPFPKAKNKWEFFKLYPGLGCNLNNEFSNFLILKVSSNHKTMIKEFLNDF